MWVHVLGGFEHSDQPNPNPEIGLFCERNDVQIPRKISAVALAAYTRASAAKLCATGKGPRERFGVTWATDSSARRGASQAKTTGVWGGCEVGNGRVIMASSRSSGSARGHRVPRTPRRTPNRWGFSLAASSFLKSSVPLPFEGRGER